MLISSSLKTRFEGKLLKNNTCYSKKYFIDIFLLINPLKLSNFNYFSYIFYQ